MYALNTFFRLFRFVTNTLFGLVIGFSLGYFVHTGQITEIINRFI